MPESSVYDLLKNMEESKIIFAYKGEMNAGLLEAVYSMMEKHMEDEQIPSGKKKKFFQILIESLQNVLHHRLNPEGKEFVDSGFTGFVIKSHPNDAYSITTGNLMENSGVEALKKKLDYINSLPPQDLRAHYQKLLSESEFSGKGGAGLGIIELARKSGNKLNYEFTQVNELYSFFCLTIIIP
jgi:Family of unknown function (DUF6272)